MATINDSMQMDNKKITSKTIILLKLILIEVEFYLIFLILKL